MHKICQEGKVVKRSIRSGNMDQNLRSSFWFTSVNLKKVEIELAKELNMRPVSLYEQVHEQLAVQQLENRCFEEIRKDLNRTHTGERVKTAEGQAELGRLLQAIAFAFKEIGYCQGMNFVASILLEVTADEAKSFLVFSYMLKTREMKFLFLPVGVSNARESLNCT